jgi:integrase
LRRKTDAEQFLTTVAHSMLQGTYIDPAAGRLRLGEWAKQRLSSRTSLKPKTVAGYESTLAVHVLPRWREVPLARITYASVAAWVSKLSNERGLSPSRVRAAYHLVTGMLDDAVKDGRLSKNPARGVDLPRLPTKDRRFLTHEQLHALAAAAGEYRVLVLTLGYGGLRWGEATALRVRDVDLARGRLHIARAMVEVNGRMLIGSPKSHQSRAVVLPRFVAEELRGLLDCKGPDDLVFASPQGSVLRVQKFRRRGFDRAATSVGLEGLVPHELRHTAASKRSPRAPRSRPCSGCSGTRPRR